jgi:putative intracellular protease/amidase/YHS domain-containing protein
LHRRDVLKSSAIACLASGLAAVSLSASDFDNGLGAKSTATPDELKPLPDPGAGALPTAFVLGDRAEVLDFCGPLEVFAGATTKEGNPLFAPYRVAASKEPVTVGGSMRVVPDYTFETAPQPKVIVIPAMNTEKNPPQMYEWIRSASKTTDLTMSVCNGAFVLAKTGLLNGRAATCHHGGYLRFTAEFPEVQLRRGARFVEDGNLATAGGVSSGIDLALRVVQRYVGLKETLFLADMLEYQGKGWLNPNSNEEYATLPKFDDEHPICPICLMEADRSISSTYQGKRYFFCSASDKDFFDKHLALMGRFLAEDSAHQPAAAHQ